MTSWIISHDQQKRRKLKVGGLVFVFKGAVSRDFFFCFFVYIFCTYITFPQISDNSIGVISIFFENSRRFCMSRGTSGINETANLPPIPLIRWYRWQICHQCHCHQKQIFRLCQWYRWQVATGINGNGDELMSLTPWQIMRTLSDCWRLKVNLKKKIYLYVDLTTQRCSNKKLNLEFVSRLARIGQHPNGL
jgi:hypothetical protein